MINNMICRTPYMAVKLQQVGFGSPTITSLLLDAQHLCHLNDVMSCNEGRSLLMIQPH